MKKMLAIVATVGCIAASSLCGCGFNFKFNTSSSTTTTTTDANGVVTSKTVTSSSHSDYPTGSCGAAAEDGEIHDVNVTFQNATGQDLYGLYCCETGDGEWSNIFDEGEYLADGNTLTDYITIHYSADHLKYDLGVEDADGNIGQFSALDFSSLDKNGFTVVFTKTEKGIGLHIDAEYIM